MALAERILKPHLSEYPEQAVAVLRDYIKQIENITP
jgi:hypothetical protein